MNARRARSGDERPAALVARHAVGRDLLPAQEHADDVTGRRGPANGVHPAFEIMSSSRMRAVAAGSTSTTSPAAPTSRDPFAGHRPYRLAGSSE